MHAAACLTLAGQQRPPGGAKLPQLAFAFASHNPVDKSVRATPRLLLDVFLAAHPTGDSDRSIRATMQLSDD